MLTGTHHKVDTFSITTNCSDVVAFEASSLHRRPKQSRIKLFRNTMGMHDEKYTCGLNHPARRSNFKTSE